MRAVPIATGEVELAKFQIRIELDVWVTVIEAPPLLVHVTVFPLVICSLAVVADRLGALFGNTTRISAVKAMTFAD